MTTSQKFHLGDYVQIADDLGPSMSHFTSGCPAIVMGSYKDEYGGSNTTSYTLFIQGKGEVSWYYESQLTMIEPGNFDLLKRWQREHQGAIDRASDLDWIFSHGPKVIDRMAGATAEALGQCLGLSNLWGSHGEYFCFWQNASRIRDMAEPFLKRKDKKGWLEFCEKFKKGNYAVNGHKGKTVASIGPLMADEAGNLADFGKEDPA